MGIVIITMGMGPCHHVEGGISKANKRDHQGFVGWPSMSALFGSSQC